MFSEPIARIIIGESDNISIKFNLNYEDLLKTCLKIFGLILIITSLDGALIELIKLIGLNLDRYELTERLYILTSFAFPYVKIFIGIALISSKRIKDKIIEV